MVSFVGCESSQRMDGEGILCVNTRFDFTEIKADKFRGFRKANDKIKLCGFYQM
jgi:hypothetical protein